MEYNKTKFKFNQNKFNNLNKYSKIQIFYFIPMTQIINIIKNLSKRIIFALDSMTPIKMLKSKLSEYLRFGFSQKKNMSEIINDFEIEDCQYSSILDILNFIIKKKFSKKKIFNLSSDDKRNIITIFKEIFEIIDEKDKFKPKKYYQISYLCNIEFIKILQINSFYVINTETIHFLSKLEMRNLEKLTLRVYEMDTLFMMKISHLNLLTLKFLDLSNNFIDLESIFFFSKIQMPNLEFLDLSNNLIESNGLKIITRMNLGKLKVLKLNGNYIENFAFEYLINSDFFQLELLQIKPSNELLANQTRKRLKSKFPFIRIC